MAVRRLPTIVRPKHVPAPIRLTERWEVKRTDPSTGEVSAFIVECLEGEFPATYRRMGYEMCEELGNGVMSRTLLSRA